MEADRTIDISLRDVEDDAGDVPVILPEDIEVIVPDEEEFMAGLEATIARSGYTWEQLEDQARAGYFETSIAGMTWYAVKGFVGGD